jgi:hypothetical protein
MKKSPKHEFERKSAASKKAWAKPGALERRSAATKKALASNEVRAKLSAGGKAAWARLSAKEKARRCAAMSKAQKNHWARLDSEAKAKRLAATIHNPECEPKRIAEMRKALATEETFAKKSDANKKSWRKPGTKKKRIAGLRKFYARPDVKKQSSARMTAIWALARGARAGRPAEKTEIFRKGAAMKKPGVTWPDIARKLTPEAWRRDPRKAGEAMRQGAAPYLEGGGK